MRDERKRGAARRERRENSYGRGLRRALLFQITLSNTFVPSRRSVFLLFVLSLFP